MSSPAQLQQQLSAIDFALQVLRPQLAATTGDVSAVRQQELFLRIFDLEQQRRDVQDQIANFTNAPAESPLSQLTTETVARQQVTEVRVTAPAPVDTNELVFNDDGELVPGDSALAAEIRAARLAEQNRVRVTAPAPVANNVIAEWDGETNSWGVWNNDTSTWVRRGLTQQEAILQEQDLSVTGDPDNLEQRPIPPILTTPEGIAAANEAIARENAINQATLQSRYNQPGSTDWRIRLQLAPGSDYLYNAEPSGVLAPLAATNGVIFPYMPQIITGYKSNYEQYQLIHSNFRGLYYRNSQVDDVQIRGIFTAQDTREAEYMLAVIHFFRSVTRMFYGNDSERGTPPPLVYLSGLGDYQFAKHPCVVSQFTYQLPDNVDYVRATNPNNYGQNLLNRRTPVRASFGGGNFAGAIRLLNALIPKGAESSTPSPNSVQQSVSNTQKSTYVPTRMELDIVLIPLQSREQISKQFSLKSFANGDLIKGGYW